MIIFIILAAAVLVVGVMVLNGEWELSWKTAGIILVGLIFIGVVAVNTGNIASDSDEIRFNIEGDAYKMYYDDEAEKYFTVEVTSLWNPVKWLGKEYLESEQVEKFFETYRTYSEKANDLNDINPFNRMNRTL